MVSRLEPIEMTGELVRQICMPGMQDGPRKQRIEADFPSIVAEEAALREAFATSTHRSLRPSPGVTQVVKSDMNWLYEHRLRDSVPGRNIWADIVALAGRRCPFCHLSKPRTIEHSYPQVFYPRLAVEPLNLVPACRDCNFERNSGHGGITVSPYFDSWAIDVPWLWAEMADGSEPQDLQFSIKRSSYFTDDQWNALTQFVEDVDLLDRYVDLAIEAFSEFVSGLLLVDSALSMTTVRPSLRDKVISQHETYGINRWQTAAFEAWDRSVARINWAGYRRAAPSDSDIRGARA